MDYFYLKIGTGNELAHDWLAGRNLLHRPAVVIYFDNFNLAQYRAGKGGKEPRRFWKCGEPEFHDRTLMVVIHEGEVWILKPSGPVRFLHSGPNAEGKPHTPKAMPVRIIKKIMAKDVPMVLASITANQFFTRGTFRQINDWGNFKAIDRVVRRGLDEEHWKPENQGPAQLLECLSSVELETLVAKLFEAHHCFVPAYRGGLMKDIDLFAYNNTSQPICIEKLIVPPKKHVSLQIKRWSNDMTKPRSVDYLMGLDAKGHDAFDAKWLLQRVLECESVVVWLRRSLDWLPDGYLNEVVERLIK